MESSQNAQVDDDYEKNIMYISAGTFGYSA